MTSLTLGVIADTHVPDRAREVPRWTMEVFRHAKVQAILHAGDLSHPRVLETLQAIAPTFAVRGNRDWWLLRHLPRARTLTFGGTTVYLTHGHMNLRRYLLDKARHLLLGNPYSLFEQRMAHLPVAADVLVFGHTHHPVNRMVEGRLLFNPGSACCPLLKDVPPSVGLLYITAGEVHGEIVPQP